MEVYMREAKIKVGYAICSDNIVVNITIPYGKRPTIALDCGKDNRPFTTIKEDVEIAYKLLDESIKNSYTKDIDIILELPKLLKYKRVSF
jgi:hypothetical protein